MERDDEQQDVTPQANSTERLLEGKCDICDKKDGFKGFNLQRCKKCGVAVHETCYAMVPTSTKNPNWECHACKMTPKGEERPRECALCSVKNGTHAMHPLYDQDGPDGKPLMLPAEPNKRKKKRQAWVHSLCALYIGSNCFTRGTVYGCDINGYYDGDDIDEDEEHEFEIETKPSASGSASDSSSSQDEMSTEIKETHEPEVLSYHHFVICGKNKDGTHNEWSKRISDFRSLTCIFCRRNDRRDRSLRIPVQCTAGGEDELDEFKGRHPNLVDGCCIAMHVGCARWMNQPVNQRVFYYPGCAGDASSNTPFVEPVCNCYCEVHARDIKMNNPKKLQKDKVMKSKIDNGPKRKRSNSSDKIDSKYQTSTKSNTLPQAGGDTTITKKLDKSRSQSSTTNPIERWFEQVKKDVQRKIDSAPQEGINIAIRNSKMRWKKKTQLSKEDFRALWKRVGIAVSGSLPDPPPPAADDESVNNISGGKSNDQNEKKSNEYHQESPNREETKNSPPSGSNDPVPEIVDGSLDVSQTITKNSKWAYLWMPRYEDRCFTVQWECDDEGKVDSSSTSPS